MRVLRRGVGLVLSAPSGAGKTSIARALCAADPQLLLSVSATTRAPRAGEQDGVAYHFRSQAEFDAMVEQGAFLEWANVFGRCYGTPRAPVIAALAEGRDVVFDIDWQGFRHLRAALPEDVVGIFILPPSLAELERRLAARGDDPATIARRMAQAEAEIAHCREFEYIVLNRDLAEAIAATQSVLHAARMATPRQIWLDGFLGGRQLPGRLPPQEGDDPPRAAAEAG
jgi:guanylate kinase